jgi:hypothetical protein
VLHLSETQTCPGIVRDERQNTVTDTELAEVGSIMRQVHRAYCTIGLRHDAAAIKRTVAQTSNELGDREQDAPSWASLRHAIPARLIGRRSVADTVFT